MHDGRLPCGRVGRRLSCDHGVGADHRSDRVPPRHQRRPDPSRPANVVDVFENEGDIPLTIITGLADENTELIVEVGFEVSDVGNLVVYHAMEARPKYR